ncbi:hypothetical protein GE300_18195 [Rhodobacteraceae bacterium 2CG4]|uniref:Uncharacterized protein n=1 Tax=Halovulum marinum TaxID=2662447 RepID=A0A6L5Z636_9RHOB|nr:hypothetical protein [Halovulum marinum]MSU91514.1 hypothetical protein [Halovulum marinum]
MTLRALLPALLLATPALATPALADIAHPAAADMPDAIAAPETPGIAAAFDIRAAHAHRDGRTVTFHMTTGGRAGAETPQPAGALGGAPVLGYVWPTSLDPAAVGFEGRTGILALAATRHPDFDDTPLNDENGDGDLGNDGAGWHSHWVVLTPTEPCGDGALAVRDIPDGAAPRLPATWPGLPLFIDSPGYTPLFDGAEISVTVGFADPEILSGARYDGVTAALQVNANVHAPLLCVTDVFDIASGDLGLPGRLD